MIFSTESPRAVRIARGARLCLALASDPVCDSALQETKRRAAKIRLTRPAPSIPSTPFGLIRPYRGPLPQRPSPSLSPPFRLLPPPPARLPKVAHNSSGHDHRHSIPRQARPPQIKEPGSARDAGNSGGFEDADPRAAQRAKLAWPYLLTDEFHQWECRALLKK